MKIFVVISILFQLTTSLFADKDYYQYVAMKKDAYALYEDGKTEKALKYVKGFIDKHPKSIRAQNLLAVLYYWSGDFVQSRSILKNILKKEKFPQALSLLKRVEKKIGKIKYVEKKVTKKELTKEKIVTKVAKEKRVVTKVTKKPSPTVDYLSILEKIKRDPMDSESRKILALHYEKIGNSKKAIYFANEVLKIDPDDKEMLSYLKSKDMKISSYSSQDLTNKAIKKLDKLFKEKNYDSFMNLYNSLEHNNVLMPTQTHVNALYCAISLKQFQKAKSILHIYRMPKNKHIAEIQELVDEKLMLSRFASTDSGCNANSCPTSR
jgi:tetratricopeptide (TPR) repeat protein